jgi:hypothetical protein
MSSLPAQAGKRHLKAPEGPFRSKSDNSWTLTGIDFISLFKFLEEELD